MNKIQLIAVGVILVCIFLNGCAVLALPAKVISGALKVLGNIVGAAFDLIKRSPKPPPGVF